MARNSIELPVEHRHSDLAGNVNKQQVLAPSTSFEYDFKCPTARRPMPLQMSTCVRVCVCMYRVSSKDGVTQLFDPDEAECFF